MASRIRDPAARAAVPEIGIDGLEEWQSKAVEELSMTHSGRQLSHQIFHKNCATQHMMQQRWALYRGESQLTSADTSTYPSDVQMHYLHTFSLCSGGN